MQTIVGVPHEAKMPRNSDTIHLFKKRSIKYMAYSFILAAISLFFARAYFIETVNQFIDDEYAAYYAGNRTVQNSTYPAFSPPTNETFVPQPFPAYEESNTTSNITTDPNSPLLPP